MNGLQTILEDKFRLKSFRKGQLSVIESVVQKRDTLAVMPTGGGKSLCYQIPALYFEGLVIVISPLIALMKDQVRSLKALGLNAGCLHSGQSLDEKREVFSSMRTQKSFVLYLSPERVQNAGFIEWVQHQKISLFAIDEAHCVSQWGPDFRPDYHKLKVLRELRPDVPILALTATATPPVLRDIAKQLSFKGGDRHIYGFYRPNLFYQIEICKDEEYKFAMLQAALKQTMKGRILIYCGTRQQCEDLSLSLQREFTNVGFYHAGMSSEERKQVQEKVDRGEVRILAATNAFGMGIDYPDVRLVVHYQTPANIESFYQEMGRAGRDGAMSRCLLLHSKKDRGLHSFFIQQSKAQKDVIKARWNALEAMTQFVESAECRHAGILTYFKDSERIQNCGHCDVCAPQSTWITPRPELSIKTKLKKGSGSTFKSKNPQVDRKFEISTDESQARALLIKDWRRQYAKERDLPAFIVFGDRTLRDLANKNPKSLDELNNIYGLGPSKIETFGAELLKVFEARC